MAQNWYDPDGLFRQFGTDKATPEVAGEYRTLGSLRVIEVKLDLTTLTSAAVIISNTLFFPKCRIEKVDISADVAAVGSGATLDFGLSRTDRTTELDYNGLIAAMPLTSFDLAGETNSLTAGSTYAGALIGTSTTNVGYLTANYNTAAITAGSAFIRVYYNIA